MLDNGRKNGACGLRVGVPQMAKEILPNWKQHELYVAALYRNMKYAIKTNTIFTGKEIDIIAERDVPGQGLTKLLVECKYSDTDMVVGNETVLNFIDAFHVLQRTHGFSKGIIVSNIGFSSQA